MTFHLEQHQTELQAQNVGPADPSGATQEIILTVNFPVVYPTHPEGDQVMWFLPLPFLSAFISQITPAMRKRFLAV